MDISQNKSKFVMFLLIAIKSKTPGHLEVDLKTPSLHENNSEFGGKDVVGPMSSSKSFSANLQKKI